jgi:hypothetical protein
LLDTGTNPIIGMGSTAADRIKQFWFDNFDKVVHPGLYNNPYADPLHPTTTPLNEKDAVAAFQLAIWKLEYDAKSGYGNPGGDLSFSFGKGYLEANVADPITKLATDWINAIHSGDAKAALFALTGGPNVNFQDQVFQVVNTGPLITTPLPDSNLIWSLVAIVGAAGHGLRRRRVRTGIQS